MNIKRPAHITALAIAILAGASTAIAQQSTDIRIATPADGATVSRNFTLSGTSSQGGGSLQLKVDGLSYIPTNLRGDSGSITEGVNLGETANQANAPFSLNVDLNGSSVVSSGGTNRQPVGDGPHKFQVCQGFGPASGCSPVITVTVGTQAVSSTTTPTPTPSTSPSPSASPLPKEKEASSELIPVLISAALGALFGYGAFRVFSRK